MNKPFLQIAVPTPLRRLFDYRALPEQLACVGARVRISFGRQQLIGVVMAYSDKTDVPLNKLKSIEEILDKETLLPRPLLQLCEWASDYYHHPIGEVIDCALPNLLRQGETVIIKRKKSYKEKLFTPTPVNFALHATQINAIHAVKNSLEKFSSFLLEGITGSGKTEVYLQIILEVLAQDKQALILVPEISLTPQMIERFQERLGIKIAVMHSQLSERERLNAWIEAREDNVKVILGTRSAIFSPMKNLGLIIIDEEHDLSYKQQEGFRYSARDLAVRRAQLENIPIVLGSATPSLESLLNVNTKRYEHLLLPQRTGLNQSPDYHMIDLRNQPLENGLSNQLIQAMTQQLQAGNQVLIFLNRRGFSPTLMCHQCGWIAECERCHTNKVFHQKENSLRCHHCDSRQIKPRCCPKCHSSELHAIGVGTERLEETLKKYFPTYEIQRVDRDTTRRKNSLDEILTKIQSGAAQILIGTQMLAKGHHFPNVTLVGIIDADSGFFSADFRAVERMGQLLLQVAGRAGRAEKKGAVYIQTHQPDHPLLKHLISQGYHSFAQALLQEREQAHLPPFRYFALLRAEATDEKIPHEFLNTIKKLAEQHAFTMNVLGPVPAPMAKRAGRYRAQLLLQAEQRQTLHALLKQLLPQIEQHKLTSKVRWSLDRDPLEMF